MDTNRFDALTRELFARPSRRGLLRTVLGSVVAFAGVAGLELPSADARKRKRKKKCKGGTKKCGKKCFDLQADPLNCGRCGNRCDVGKACRDGNCSCPEDETRCGSACCAIGLSCIDGQCSGK